MVLPENSTAENSIMLSPPNASAQQSEYLPATNNTERKELDAFLESVSEQEMAEKEESDIEIVTTEGKLNAKAGITQILESFEGNTDAVLAFSDRKNGGCRLFFGAPDGIGALEVNFDPDNVEASTKKITDALRSPLRDVLNGTASANAQKASRLFSRAKEPTLRMLFQVDSLKIRHQMSIQIQQLIQKVIYSWAEEKEQKVPALFWQDEIGLWE